jgi:hypothetical protein
MAQPLIEKDFYGKDSSVPLTPPNLASASLSSTGDRIELVFDQPIEWNDQLVREFYLDGIRAKIVAGSVSGNILTLELSEPTAATKITYLKEVDWSQQRLLKGRNGLAALTFCDVLLNGK